METTQFPHTLPPTHRCRTLILCFDGTDNKISIKPSNVAQFFSLLKKDVPSHQLLYYQTGIGTYTSSNVIDPVSSTIAKTMDSLFAISIASHVQDGYDFIMQHYLDGDKICIFGFSRGGYTARALAGMIHKVGLLPRGNTRHLKYAYKVFLQTGQKGWDQATEFKRCFCMDIPIEFVGIWDSVGSVGLNSPGLPFSKASTTIKTFRHALSLDERRAMFNANAWHCQEDVLSKDPGRDGNKELETTTKAIHQTLQFEEMYHPDHSFRTDVLEVWFAGCHSDIGGGSIKTGTRHSLSRIPLRWMVRECFKANTGILFSVPFLRDIGLDPVMLYPFVVPRPPPLPIPQQSTPTDNVPGPSRIKESTVKDPDDVVEEVEDLEDVLSPMHDQLNSKSAASAPFWWILEAIPLKRWYCRSDGTAISYIGLNFGRPRFAPRQHSNGIKVHRSVKIRMEHPGLRYRPKTHIAVEPTWVD